MKVKYESQNVKYESQSALHFDEDLTAFVV